MNSLPCFGLQDKVLVVTGAGRGIGRAIALDANKSGAKVAVGSRTSSELETLANEIIEAGGECFAHTLDVTDESSINTFMSAVIEGRPFRISPCYSPYQSRCVLFRL